MSHECHGVSNPTRITSKLYYWPIVRGNPMVISGFPTQRASNMEIISMLWQLHTHFWNNVLLVWFMYPWWSMLIWYEIKWACWSHSFAFLFFLFFSQENQNYFWALISNFLFCPNLQIFPFQLCFIHEQATWSKLTTAGQLNSFQQTVLLWQQRLIYIRQIIHRNYWWIISLIHINTSFTKKIILSIKHKFQILITCCT